jgi:hypothetical protein
VKAQDDEQGMLEQEGVQLGHVALLFADLDQKGFEVGGFRMQTWAGRTTAGLSLF